MRWLISLAAIGMAMMAGLSPTVGAEAESGNVIFGDGVRGQRSGSSLSAQGATPTDSTVDELSGIVVLCAEGDQNACVPRGDASSEGETEAETRIPESLRHRNR